MLEASPGDPEAPYVITRDGRLFRSDDGGQSWRPTFTDSLGTARSLIVDPVDSDRLYLSLSQTNYEHTSLLSDDGGQTWQPIAEGHHVLTVAPSAPRILYAEDARSDDGGLTWVVAERPDRFWGITVHPRDPDRVFGFGKHFLHRSVDGGQSWTNVLDAPVGGVAFYPETPDTVLVTSGWGLYRSQDGGNTWDQPSLDPDGATSRADSVFWFTAHRMWVSPDPAHEIYTYGTYIGYGAKLGIVRSQDVGDSWIHIDASLQRQFEGYQEIKQIVLTAPGTLLASTKQGRLYRSTDEGSSWRRTGEQIARPSLTQLVRGQTAEGEIWYGANEQGLFRSRDMGQSWTQILKPQAWVFVDPTAAEQVYAHHKRGRFLNDWRLLYSADAGQEWVDAGLQDHSVRALAVVPGSQGSAFASSSSNAGGALQRTADYGHTWEPVDIVPEGQIAREIFINPHAAEQVFLHTAGKVHRSADLGSTWELTSVQVDRSLVMAWSSSDPAIAYAGNRAREEAFVGEDPSYFYRSSDGGSSWEQVESFCCSDLADLIVHPHEPRLLFGRLYNRAIMSQDGGRSWHSMMPEGWDRPIGSLFLDTQDPLRLYAATESGLFTARFAELPGPLEDPPELTDSFETAPPSGALTSVYADGPVYALAADREGTVWFTTPDEVGWTDGRTVELVGWTDRRTLEGVTGASRIGPDADLDIDLPGQTLDQPGDAPFRQRRLDPCRPRAHRHARGQRRE